MTQNDLATLDLEYRLTIAHRINCPCAPYFARRREVLMPEVMKEAERQNADAVNLFAAFALGVHDRHLTGFSLEVSA